MPVTSFPVISGAQVTAGGDTTAKTQVGALYAYRVGDQWSIVQYVQAANGIIARYLACVQNDATLKQYSVKLPATGDGGGAIRGIAIATIASQTYGFVTVAGYVENVLVSSSAAASAEYLRLSGSTAGQLSALAASVFNVGTQGNGSMFLVVAQVNAALASSAVSGSAHLVGFWG